MTTPLEAQLQSRCLARRCKHQLAMVEKIWVAREVIALAPAYNRTQTIALDDAESHPDEAAERTVDRVWQELQIERYHQPLIDAVLDGRV